jgi:hypothetical protein
VTRVPIGAAHGFLRKLELAALALFIRVRQGAFPSGLTPNDTMHPQAAYTRL